MQKAVLMAFSRRLDRLLSSRHSRSWRYCLLGCDTVYSGKYLPMVWRTWCLHILPWRWSQQVPPEYWSVSTRLHGVKSQSLFWEPQTSHPVRIWILAVVAFDIDCDNMVTRDYKAGLVNFFPLQSVYPLFFASLYVSFGTTGCWLDSEICMSVVTHITDH